VIQYRPFGGGLRNVTVETKEADVKNGRPGFDGITDRGEYVWGYDDQIIAVVKF
jgi:hypothetical protein